MALFKSLWFKALHLRVLKRIFTTPIPSNIKWKDVKKLLLDCKIEIRPARLDHTLIVYKEKIQEIQKLSDDKTLNIGTVNQVKVFLEELKITPDKIDEYLKKM